MLSLSRGEHDDALAKYRQALPQMGDALFLTDGGLETTLIFHDGLELPHFAAFALLARRRGPGGAAALLRALRRASPSATGAGWCSRRRPGGRTPTGAAQLGYAPEALDAVNAAAVDFVARSATPRRRRPRRWWSSGVIGPRGDGYAAGAADDRRGGRGLPRAGRSASSRRPAPTW